LPDGQSCIIVRTNESFIKINFASLLVALAFFVGTITSHHGQDAAFTYQGCLKNGGGASMAFLS